MYRTQVERNKFTIHEKQGNKLFVVDGKGMIDKNNMFFSTMTLYFTPSIATFDTNKSYNTDI